MALHLITGYAGQEHITSADQGAYNMGTFGEGEFVLDRGSKFAATVVTNNSITIADGEALMQGRFIKLAVGTTESVTIDNGTSGMKRKDLIVLKYQKNSSTGVETVSLAVKKGTASSGTPSDPSVTTGDITDGTDLVNEMKLYRVNLDGLNIVSVDTLFSVKTTMVEYMDEYQLPVADANTLGGVKIGTNITRASDGKISIPTASASQRGVVKVKDTDGGIHINNSSGVLFLDVLHKSFQIHSYVQSSDLVIPASGCKYLSIEVENSEFAQALNYGTIDYLNVYTNYSGDKVFGILVGLRMYSSEAYVNMMIYNLESTAKTVTNISVGITYSR